MRCERAQDLFSDYCEGSVSQALLVPLESHLDQCAVCRSQVRDLQDVWQLLDSSPRIEPPSDFRAAVWKRIETTQERRRSPLWAGWQRLFARPAFALGTAVLLVVVLAGTIGPGRRWVDASLGWWLPSWLHSAPAQVSATNPHYQGEGRRVLVVTLTCSDQRTIEVRAADPAVRTVSPASAVQVGPGTPATVTLELAPGVQARSVGLSVREAQDDANAEPVVVGLPTP